jgi:hypothetical protein
LIGSADVATAISLYGAESRPFINCLYGFISLCGAFGGSPMASLMVHDNGAARSFGKENLKKFKFFHSI